MSSYSQKQGTQSSIFGVILFLLMSSFIAFILGAFVSIFPYWFVFEISLAIFFVVIAWLWPEFAAVAILAIGSGIIKPQFLPSVHIIGGTVPFPDMALLLLMGMSIIKFYGNISSIINPLKKIFFPQILLFVLLALSIWRAKFEFGVDAKDTLGEAHHFLHWLLLPLILLIIDDKAKLDRFIFGVFAVAVLFSIGQLVQSFTGISVFGQGALGNVKTVGVEYGGLERSQSNGVYFSIFLMYVLVSNYLLGRRLGVFSIPLSMVLILAVLVSFGRGIWFSTIMGLLVIATYLGFKRLFSLAAVVLIAATLSIAAIGLYKPESITALKDRAFSAGEDIKHGSSLNWRFYENKMAFEKISRYPVLGIGLGNSYRPVSSSDVISEQTRYIHSGYLYLMLKMGVIAIIYIVSLFLVFVFYVRNVLRGNLAIKYRAVVLSCFALFIQFFMLSVTQPEFMMMYWGISMMAMLIAMVSVIDKLNKQGLLNTGE